MANEVIIEEYAVYPGNPPIPPQFLTTQIKNIAATATFNAQTKFVRIKSKDTGFWYSFNGNAAAATAGSSWLAANQFVDHIVSYGTTFDTAAAS